MTCQVLTVRVHLVYTHNHSVNLEVVDILTGHGTRDHLDPELVLQV